jgi:predicted outer membrane repeat protein
MGVVYQAYDPDLRRDVALKVLLVDTPPTPHQLERFRREYEGVARIRHPNVIGIHHAGQHEGKPYFVQDLIEGSSLEDRLTKGPLPLDQAAQLTLEIANALHFAHEQGIFHRDVKPSNILLTPGGAPVLVDFGLVKDTTLIFSKPSLTKTGMGLGSPGYWSPEQAAGSKEGAEGAPLGPSSDVYSLGATLYALLTGSAPFVGRTVIEDILFTVSKAPVPPSRLRADLDPSLESICLKALQKDPADRYLTAGAFAEDLGRYLSGDPVKALPAPRRHWPVIVGILLLLTIGAVRLSGLSSEETKEHPSRLAAAGPDSVAPVLSLTSPLDWTVATGDSIQFQGTVADTSAVEVKIGTSTATVGPGEPFTLQVPLQVGINSLEIALTDTSGNPSDPIRLNVLRAPTVHDNAVLIPGYDPTKSTYEIKSTIEVSVGQTLVLGPGTTLRFAQGAALACKGQLWLAGDANRPVRLEPSDRSWEGVRLEGGEAFGVFSHANLSGAVPDFLARFIDKAQVSQGGALSVLSGARAIVADSVLQDSQAGGRGAGGGLHVSGQANVVRTTVKGCRAANGGGIYAGPLSELDVTNCTLTGNTAENDGGGFAAVGEGKPVTLQDVRFIKNTSKHQGGGVSLQRPATLRDCHFLSNSCPRLGGGLSAPDDTASPLVLERVQFTKNTAGGAAGAQLGCSATVRDSHFEANADDGLLIWHSTQTSLESVTFSNHADRGHSLVVLSATATLKGCTFRDSTVTAIRVDQSTLSCTESTFRDNQSLHGGAISAVNASVVQIADCQFINNRAQQTGGAIFVGPVMPDDAAGTALTAISCVFSGNSASRGADVYLGPGAIADKTQLISNGVNADRISQN